MRKQVVPFNNPVWFHPYICIQTENHSHWISLKFWSFLLYCLLSPKLTTRFCQERAAFPKTHFGERINKKLPNIQFYSISGVTMYPFFFTFRVAIDVVFGHGTTAVFPSFQQVPSIFHSSIRWLPSSSQPGRGPVKRNVWKTPSNGYSTVISID